MEVLLFLLPVLLMGGLLYLFIVTLVSVMKLEGSERIAWLLLIILTFPIGSIIYLFLDPNKARK